MQLSSLQATRSITRQRSRNRVAPLLAASAVAAVMFAATPATAASCSDIASISLPNTTITLTQSYAAGETVSGNTNDHEMEFSVDIVDERIRSRDTVFG